MRSHIPGTARQSFTGHAPTGAGSTNTKRQSQRENRREHHEHDPETAGPGRGTGRRSHPRGWRHGPHHRIRAGRHAQPCSGQPPYTASISSATHTATEHGFFFTNNRQVCVGQANLREDFNDSTGLAERVRVHSGGASGPLIFQTFNNDGSGAGTGTLTFTTHVNTLFNVSQVTVCVALVNQSDHSVVDNVVICKTLG